MSGLNTSCEWSVQTTRYGRIQTTRIPSSVYNY